MAGSKGDTYKAVNDKLWKETEAALELKEETKGDARGFVEAFLERYDEQDCMKYQALHLDPSIRKPSKKRSQEPVESGRTKSKNKLSRRQKRKLGLMNMSTEEQKYSMYVPLHELWKGYIEELFKGVSRNPQALAQKILKADLHGCLIAAVESKCSSVVGLEGIIVQETQNTFRVVCTDNRMKTIPKGRTVFTFAVSGHKFTLYGQNLLFKAADRSAKKFKDKPFIDM